MTEPHSTKFTGKSDGWIAQRLRPGNWIDIAPQEEIPPEIAGPSRAILHIFQICFSPEIRQRLQRQDIDLNFHLNAAQMLQKPAGGSVVRLNDEVRGIALLKIDREVSKGDSIPQSDLRNMEHFDLIESELDCGHFTMLWVETGWFSCFDFRSGRAKCMSMLEAASEFLTAARLAADNGLPRPSIDSLFSSCELISKVHLILYRNNAANSKSHSAVSSAINLWGKLGNIDQAFLVPLIESRN